MDHMLDAETGRKSKQVDVDAITFDGQKRNQETVDPVIEFKAQMETAILEAEGIVYILPHAEIDFDCIGAAIGLMNSLKHKFPNKKIKVVIPDKRNDPKNNQMNPYANVDGVEWADAKVVDKLVSTGLLIMVDSNAWSFVGISQEQLAVQHKMGSRFLILDHHGESQVSSPTEYIEPAAFSTSELVARMYLNENMSQETALLLLLGLVSDTGGLKHVYGEENIARIENLFQKLAKIAGYDLSQLIEIVGERLTTKNELTAAEKLEATKFRLVIPEFPDDVVKVFFDLNLDFFPDDVDAGKVTDVILNHHLDMVANYVKSDVSATKRPEFEPAEPIADFTLFIKPVRVTQANLFKLQFMGFDGKIGDLFWEIKMRTNSIFIVRQIGEKLHRGGKPGSGKAEVWLTSGIQKAIENGQLSLTNMFALVCKYFAKIYAEVRAEELAKSGES